MQTQIRRRRMQRLLSVCTDCLNYRKSMVNETVLSSRSGPFSQPTPSDNRPTSAASALISTCWCVLNTSGLVANCLVAVSFGVWSGCTLFAQACLSQYVMYYGTSGHVAHSGQFSFGSLLTTNQPWFIQADNEHSYQFRCAAIWSYSSLSAHA